MAVFQLNKEKAPSPDGFTIPVYQECWDVIKEDLMRVFIEFHTNGGSNVATTGRRRCGKRKGAFRPMPGWEMGRDFGFASRPVCSGKLGKDHWKFKGGVKLARMGGPFILIEFENKAEANKVLLRGFRCFKDSIHTWKGGPKGGVFSKW
ncbi:hypothetical protein CK203_035059 [Vitis vinifera]|uniref:DUF4283 domain-containing protein n=1 Tax=Vitis vinifera TaxID=29760 RepID=A0A438I9U1_VITVI|nr:hypothetical protein CK203_035059 [Vitis vinifera]